MRHLSATILCLFVVVSCSSREWSSASDKLSHSGSKSAGISLEQRHSGPTQLPREDLDRMSVSFGIGDLQRLREGRQLQIIVWNPNPDVLSSVEFEQSLRKLVVIESLNNAKRIPFDIEIVPQDSGSPFAQLTEKPPGTITFHPKTDLSERNWYIIYLTSIPSFLQFPQSSRTSLRGAVSARFYVGSMPTLRSILLCETSPSAPNVYGEISFSEMLAGGTNIDDALSVSPTLGGNCHITRLRPESNRFSRLSFECNTQILEQAWNFELRRGLFSPSGKPLAVFPRAPINNSSTEIEDLELVSNDPTCRRWHLNNNGQKVPTRANPPFIDIEAGTIISITWSFRPELVIVVDELCQPDKSQQCYCRSNPCLDTTVSFRNDDKIPHQIDFEDPSLTDSPIIQPGESWTTSSFAGMRGNFKYRDSQSSSMRGQVRVVGIDRSNKQGGNTP